MDFKNTIMHEKNAKFHSFIVPKQVKVNYGIWWEKWKGNQEVICIKVGIMVITWAGKETTGGSMTMWYSISRPDWWIQEYVLCIFTLHWTVMMLYELFFLCVTLPVELVYFKISVKLIVACAWTHLPRAATALLPVTPGCVASDELSIWPLKKIASETHRITGEVGM